MEALSGPFAAAVCLDTDVDGRPLVPVLTMTACATATCPGGREVRDDLEGRCPRLVDDVREPCVHLGCHLGGAHCGERLSALVFHECGVGAIRGAQQSSTLQSVDLAELLVGPGEPGLELLLPFATDVPEPGHYDEHAFLHQLVLSFRRFCAIGPTRAAGRHENRLSLLWLQVPKGRGSIKIR